MNWNTITESIQNDLLSRNLKNPNIRINALKRIEVLFQNYYPKLLENPKIGFNSIDKKELKKQLSYHKDSGKISSSESSIINEIYSRI